MRSVWLALLFAGVGLGVGGVVGTVALAAQEFHPPPVRSAGERGTRLGLLGFGVRGGIDLSGNTQLVFGVALDAGNLVTSRFRLRPSGEIGVFNGVNSYVGSLEGGRRGACRPEATRWAAGARGAGAGHTSGGAAASLHRAAFRVHRHGGRGRRRQGAPRDRPFPREVLLRGRVARLRHPHHLRRRASLEGSRVPPPSPPARLSGPLRRVRKPSARLKQASARRSCWRTAPFGVPSSSSPGAPEGRAASPSRWRAGTIGARPACVWPRTHSCCSARATARAPGHTEDWDWPSSGPRGSAAPATSRRWWAWRRHRGAAGGGMRSSVWAAVCGCPWAGASAGFRPGGRAARPQTLAATIALRPTTGRQ